MGVFNKDPLEKIKDQIQNDGRFFELLNEIKTTYHFLDNFSFLIDGRNISFTRPFKPFIPVGIVNSTIQTLASIRLCCEHGNLADANILLRKYRDDLFFYLYIVLVSREVITDPLKDLDKHDKNVEAWIDNRMSDVYITDILKYIGNHPILKPAVQKYKLHTTFSKIGNVLNTYTHGNGIKYYNRSLYAYDDKYLSDSIHAFSEHLTYITVTYILLLTLISPLAIMSIDYVDHLDRNQDPPPDSQYWVAPFVQHYLYAKRNLLGEDCIHYLQKETFMDFT